MRLLALKLVPQTNLSEPLIALCYSPHLLRRALHVRGAPRALGGDAATAREVAQVAVPPGAVGGRAARGVLEWVSKRLVFLLGLVYEIRDQLSLLHCLVSGLHLDLPGQSRKFIIFERLRSGKLNCFLPMSASQGRTEQICPRQSLFLPPLSWQSRWSAQDRARRQWPVVELQN